jgi:hypothetical protein
MEESNIRARVAMKLPTEVKTQRTETLCKKLLVLFATSVNSPSISGSKKEREINAPSTETATTVLAISNITRASYPN